MTKPGRTFPPRRAASADVPAVAELARRAYGKWVSVIGAEPQPMGADYEAIVANDVVWVVDGAQGLAGCLVLQKQADHLLIWSVAVDPAAQGAGLGKRLMGFAERQARDLGFAEIRLYTNARFTANRDLYARLGYVETHQDEIDGRTRVHMRKELKR